MLTLASALSSLTTAGAFVAGASDGTKTALLNEAIERLLESGRFVGTQQTLSISVNATGVLTLPRHFSAILGATVEGYATDLASKWWTYLSGANACNQLYVSNVQDQGHGFCTFTDPPSSVRLKLAAVGVTDTALVQGLDENGDVIYANDGSQGWTLTINDASWSTKHFTRIDSIQMPAGAVVKTLTCIDVGNTVRTLGIYEPSETVPSYRRYYIPAAVDADDDLETTAVVALCNRRFVPLVDDSDLVYPSHIGGLKNSCLAVHFENEADEARSAYHFEQAIKLLNSQLKRATPESEQGRIRVNYVGGGTPRRAIL